MPRLPDLVSDSKLETEFSGKHTVHVYYVTGATLLERKIKKEQRWEEDRYLGSGGAGTVSLQKSVAKNGEEQYRAVKKIRKAQGCNDYGTELEIIAKFSHQKVRECSISRFAFLSHSFAFAPAIGSLLKSSMKRTS